MHMNLNGFGKYIFFPRKALMFRCSLFYWINWHKHISCTAQHFPRLYIISTPHVLLLQIKYLYDHENDAKGTWSLSHNITPVILLLLLSKAFLIDFEAKRKNLLANQNALWTIEELWLRTTAWWETLWTSLSVTSSSQPQPTYTKTWKYFPDDGERRETSAMQFNGRTKWKEKFKCFFLFPFSFLSSFELVHNHQEGCLLSHDSRFDYVFGWTITQKRIIKNSLFAFWGRRRRCRGGVEIESWWGDVKPERMLNI